VNCDLLRRACAVHPITAVQSEYSLWTRDVEKDVHPRFASAAAVTNKAIADTVRAVAEAKGVAPAQIALAWVYAQQDRLGVPVVPIPGTKRVRWLEQNIAALDVTLTADDLALLAPLGSQVSGARYAS
jgi:aryl-alcohol dehydrogenase-like predicted oxidoreductase